jgi:protocatechuate 3,4-dioxygenase beta subunit
VELVNGPANVLTGPDGKFEFVNVPPGAYEVVASKPTYANGGFGITKAEDFPEGFTVATGATVSGLRIALNRHAVIAGRVTDDSGVPVVGQIISVMKRAASGELEPFRGDNVSIWARRLPVTDDQGRYFAYLPPGVYYAVVDVVREFRRLPFVSDGGEAKRNTDFVSQFFPASASFEGARPISVQPGEVRRDVDFRLTRSPVVTVSGRVERPPTAAATDALTVRLRLDHLPDGVQASVNKDDSFVFPAVVSGDYEFSVEFCESQFLASVAGRPRTTTSEYTTRLTVPAEDVGGIVVHMPPAPSVSLGTPDARATRTAAPSGASSLQVQVVDDRGVVVPRARIDLRHPDVPVIWVSDVSASGLSDQKGSVTFANVTERSVSVSVEKPGFVKNAYGQQMTFDKGVEIVLMPREAQQIRMSLERASVISGTIRYDRGEPATEVEVTARRWTTESGRSILKDLVSVLTDPDGRFRFHGLSSGNYVVVARQAPLWDEEGARRLGNRDSILRREDWFATIPATISPDSRRGITIRAGDQREDLNLVLAHRATTMVNVEGRVHLPGTFSIEPMTPRPRIVEYDDPFDISVVDSANRPARMDSDGRFWFRDVRPGKHLIHWSSSYGPSSLWAVADVDTRHGPVSNLVLKAVPAASVSGRVRLRSDSTEANRGRLQLSLEDHRNINFSEVFLEAVGTDGKFSFGGVPPGEYSIEAFGYPLGRWRAESVMVNGRDALDFPFQVKNGRSVDNAIVTLTNLPADVSGIVVDSGGGRASGAIVAMFASDSRYWTVDSRRVKLAQADSQGRFALSELAEGRYLMAVVDNPLRSGDWDPQLLARLKPRGIPITVVLGEPNTVELRAR